MQASFPTHIMWCAGFAVVKRGRDRHSGDIIAIKVGDLSMPVQMLCVLRGPSGHVVGFGHAMGLLEAHASFSRVQTVLSNRMMAVIVEECTWHVAR